MSKFILDIYVALFGTPVNIVNKVWDLALGTVLLICLIPFAAISYIFSNDKVEYKNIFKEIYRIMSNTNKYESKEYNKIKELYTNIK